MLNNVPMTTQGAKALRDELTILKNNDRPNVIQAIADARAHGDLKENAEYHAARERQSFIETRIKDIEGKLSNAQVIDVKSLPATGKIVFGTTVTLLNMDNDETMRFTIVGEDEANIKLAKISVTSPIARAVIGKKAHDEVCVHTPNGDVMYEIETVEYL